MTRAWLSLGSNIEPERHLRAAAAALRARFGEVHFSPVYRTPAVGFDGPDFLNCAAEIDSDLGPVELDAWLHALEDAHGRRRDGPRFSSRTLDIDLLLHGMAVLEGPGHLKLPRPELDSQAFVLRPMADLAPHLVHPTRRQSMAALLAGCPGADALEATDIAL